MGRTRSESSYTGSERYVYADTLPHLHREWCRSVVTTVSNSSTLFSHHWRRWVFDFAQVALEGCPDS